MSIDTTSTTLNTTQTLPPCEGAKKENKLPLDVQQHIAPKQTKTVSFNEEIFYKMIETAKEIENPRELWYSEEDEANFLADSRSEQNATSTPYAINQENIPPQMSPDEILAQKVAMLQQVACDCNMTEKEVFDLLLSTLEKRV